jgi:hypothetical protein
MTRVAVDIVEHNKVVVQPDEQVVDVYVTTGSRSALFLRGLPIGDLGTPSVGTALVWNGDEWVPQTLPGLTLQVLGETATRVNGTTYNTAFNYAPGTVRVFVNGLRENYVSQVGGLTLTFEEALNLNDVVTVDYERA